MQPAACQLSIIGNFELRHDGAPVVVRDAAARLLALLALIGRRRPASRAVVAERLWSDDDPARCAGRLRSALWRLPRVDDAPLVDATATALRLADHVSVDLWHAECHARELADAATVPVPTPDLGGFADDILPDWPEAWLLMEREAFRQVRLHALERASEQLRHRGSHDAALQAALTAVACEPLRETAHRRVIEVHLAEGNHAEALRQYQVYRRLLAAELGLVPTVTMRSLVADLLARPADHHVPVRSSPRRPG